MKNEVNRVVLIAYTLDKIDKLVRKIIQSEKDDSVESEMEVTRYKEDIAQKISDLYSEFEPYD